MSYVCVCVLMNGIQYAIAVVAYDIAVEATWITADQHTWFRPPAPNKIVVTDAQIGQPHDLRKVCAQCKMKSEKVTNLVRSLHTVELLLVLVIVWGICKCCGGFKVGIGMGR